MASNRAQITAERVLDESGILQSISRLESGFQSMSAVFQQELQKIKKEFNELKTDAKALGDLASKINISTKSKDKIVELSKALDDNAKAQQAAKEKQEALSKAIYDGKQFLEASKQATADYRRQILDLANGYGDNRAKLQELQTQMRSHANVIRAVTTAQKEEVNAVKYAAGSYNELAQLTNKLVHELQALPNAFNKTTGEIDKNNAHAVLLQQQILKNTNALKNMDGQMGRHFRNVGNYNGALKGLQNSMTSLATEVIGVATAWEAVSQSVKVIAIMERQTFALKNASANSKEFSANLALVRKIALDTGAPLEATMTSLRKFTGSLRDTKIEGEQGRRIFEAFSNTFTASGASADEFNRATKALSDMMSKGTVQAEELKQQLGDAMPNALGVFAKAMNVSKTELLGMMNNGEILAEDILPKVAKVLEQTTGKKAQDNLNTISGGWEKVKNQTKLFLTTLDNGGGIITRTLGKILDGLSAIVSLADTGMKAIDRIFKKWNNGPTQVPDDPFAAFAAQSPADMEKQLSDLKYGMDKARAEYKKTRAELEALIKAGKGDSFEAGGLTGEGGLRGELKKQAALVNQYVETYKKFSQEYEKVRKRIFGGGDTEVTTEVNRNNAAMQKLVDQARTLIDKIPEGLIGENGKANISKDQTKAIREVKDQITDLYGTIGKADREAMNLDRLIKTIDTLLHGERKKGEPRTKKELTDFQKDIKDIIKTVDAGVDEISKNRQVSPITFLKLRDAKKELEQLDDPSEQATAALKKVDKILRSLNDSGRLVGETINEIFHEGTSVNIRKVADDIIKASIRQENKEVKFDPDVKIQRDLSNVLNLYTKHYAERSQLDRKYLEFYGMLTGAEKGKLKAQLDEIQHYERLGMNKTAAAKRREHEEEKARLKQIAQMRLRYAQESIKLAGTVGDAIFQIGTAYRDKELSDLAKAKENELKLVGDNKEAQERVNKSFAAKEAEIKRRQAIADKANAIFQIALNTAIGISSAIASSQWWMIPFVAATGAIQAAVVAAKPIPQYYKGTSYSVEGYAQVAERGPEAVIDPSGKTRIVEEPSVVYLKRGSVVKTAKETEQMLREMSDVETKELNRQWFTQNREVAVHINKSDGSDRIVAAILNHSLTPKQLEEALGRALDARPVYQTVYDGNGQHNYYTKKGITVEYLNQKQGF